MFPLNFPPSYATWSSCGRLEADSCCFVDSVASTQQLQTSLSAAMSWLGGLLGKDSNAISVPVLTLFQRLEEAQTPDDRKKTIALLRELSDNEEQHKVSTYSQL
jgi:hypothetical protein